MEYVCRDPKAKVRAPNIRILVDSFQFVPSLVDELLRKYGFTRAMFEGSEYVSLQSTLEMLRDISQRVGPEKVRQMGSKAIEAAMFPPQFDTVESVLLALDTIYSFNHLGDVGRYRSRTLEDGAIEVRCETPYPRAFERGLVEGIARNAGLTKGHRYDVEYVEGPLDADLTCTLVVRAR